MKLEKFKTESPKKKILIIGSIILFLLVTIVVVYRSFAFFEENQEFNVIKGSVPNQNYDLMLSFQIEENGNRRVSDTIPNDKNYEVSMICNNGAKGNWDYESWGPIINNLTDTRTKCTILFAKKYREEVLNGTDPVLANGLIPVTIEENGSVKKANTSQEWYKYTDQRWANAVILEDESITYQNGETIPEDNIESYFVWIPKYRYKLWDLGNYTGLTSIQNKVHDIELIFGDYDTVDSKEGECKAPGVSGSSGNCKVGDNMTHPAFLSFGTKGIWVGKFEVGYKGATSTTEAEQNINDTEKVEIKPNVYSWRGINIATAHLNSYNYKREYDSHLMKNTEWGAVAYLQHSIYGSRESVRNNNNISIITGYGNINEPSCSYAGSNQDCLKYEATSLNEDGEYTKRYNTEVGYKASTSGNITGIYDMSGGTWEFTMGGMLSSDNKTICAAAYEPILSGFSGPYCAISGKVTGIALPEKKYYDIYANADDEEHYNRRILGDATGEMGSFSNITNGLTRKISSWYSDEAFFISNWGPWFIRGGASHHGSGTGIFAFEKIFATTHGHMGYRVALAI